jgi:hypothetical protein
MARKKMVQNLIKKFSVRCASCGDELTLSDERIQTAEQAERVFRAGGVVRDVYGDVICNRCRETE